MIHTAAIGWQGTHTPKTNQPAINWQGPPTYTYDHDHQPSYMYQLANATYTCLCDQLAQLSIDKDHIH